ncbi:MAG: MaoC/PaaZ C-terminal domain-containing protein [Spirochaetota bacterium]|nr:MaoC/PaaZ C-terminal domain-containing protein [Spirochaetota bacterium]
MPLNEKVIGKKYKSDPVKISQHESIYYALAYNEDNDAYFDNRRPGGIIAPPMYAVFYGAGPTAQIMFDAEIGINMMFVVHYSQYFEWIKPVKPDDEVTSEGTITHITVKEKGSILGWETVTKNQHGEVVLKAKWEFFDRSAGSGKPDEKPETETNPSQFVFEETMKVKNGQTYIYAEPSGDHNPIHVDDEFAKKVGLPGIILQGLCTMAFSHKMAVDHLTPDRDPLKVRELYVRFARPVLPGQTLRFKGYTIEKLADRTRYGIVALNNDGKDVLRNAWCSVAK